MRLIGCRDFLPAPFSEQNVPPFAILSHTWGTQSDEITLDDLIDGNARRKPAFRKLEFCAARALDDYLEYFWMDSCCIDRSSATEISEAVNSIYKWYHRADRCFVYLSDVQNDEAAQLRVPDHAVILDSLRASRWFKRGWTLVELLAPQRVEFFSLEGRLIGDRHTLERDIVEITGLPSEALTSRSLGAFTAEQILSWASARETSLPEDSAYCLLGLLEISMPLAYGEGRFRAMSRLMTEINRVQFQANKAAAIEPSLYSPLPTARSFRILALNPGPEDTALTGHLKTWSLERKSPYTALSYTWGTEPAIHEIFIDAQPFQIRPNLYYFLKRVRSLEAVRHIWVDTLCINQDDIAERSNQVRHMSTIFSNAMNVKIWLGEADATSHYAMRVTVPLAANRYEWTHNWPQDSNLLALGRLLERPWFTRAWVVQEAALSQDSEIFCGGAHVPMSTFAAAIKRMQRRIKDFPREAQAFSQLEMFRHSPAIKMLAAISLAITSTPLGLRNMRQLPLEQLIDMCTFCNTTDKRDVIYSLLSLANDTDVRNAQDQQIEAIEADYDKSVRDVFTQYVKYCVATSSSLDILCRPWAPESELSPHSEDHLREPSWVASRRRLPFGLSVVPNHRQHGDALVGRFGERRYNAHDQSVPRMRQCNPTEPLSSNGLLHCQGIILGTVVQRAPRMAGAIISRTALELLASGSSGTPDFSADAVWRSLCASLQADGSPATEHSRNAFERAWQLSLADEGVPEPDQDFTHAPDNIDVEELLKNSKLGTEARTYLESVRNIVWNRRVFKGTALDRKPVLGLAPETTGLGDSVCILFGCSVPLVLRKRVLPDGERWVLIGEAYVHGFMNGEAFKSPSVTKHDAIIEFALW